jgi:hypothetical protein
MQMQEEEDRVLKEHEEQLLKDLKEAVRAEKEGRKITRQTKPAIVLENREPPEIPEFKMEELLPSNLTGEDAIWYMFRLSLFIRMEQAKREEEKRKKDNELKMGEEGSQNRAAMSSSGEETDATEKIVSESEVDEATLTKEEREGESLGIDATNDSPRAKDDKNERSVTNTKSKANGNSGTKKSKTKSKKSNKKKASSSPPPAPRPIDNQQSFERDPEVERILNEVVETLNRNQTPVQRKIPSRVIPRSPDQLRNSDEIRIRHSPRARPWPTLDECQDKPLPRFLVFTSTWLSVTAKGVK